MEHRRKDREIVDRLEAITCDRCGQKYDVDECYEIQEFVRLRDTGGYASIWGDGTTWVVDLCQKCAKQVLGDYARIVPE